MSDIREANKRSPGWFQLLALVVSSMVMLRCIPGQNDDPSEHSSDPLVRSSKLLERASEPHPSLPLAAKSESASQVRLPIEVIGEEGFTQTVALILREKDLQKPLRFWMQAHSLSYADKASIRFNDGPWVNLNDTTVLVEGMGKTFGGIGGAFATLKLSLEVPAEQLKPGKNQVSFRFNQTDGRSIGFRVLRFNFLLPDGSRVLEDSVFTQDDPTGWEPPFSDAASIAEGEQLWRTRALVSSYRDGQPIQARCMDCHARDGRDLKYFSYSNHAIIERSKFHGLTEEEGMKIASYIRTLPGVPSPGRPWNPPYQPGPGLDAKPATQWSAGAGVDAVLEKDRDMLPHLFPDGITAAAISTTTNLSAREVPVMFQLPDWNHWLPSIHPKDAWGDAFVNDPLNKYYAGEGTAPDIPASIRELAAQVREAGYGNYREKLFYPNRAWVLAVYKFLSPRYPDATTGKDVEYSRKIYSTALWHMVKTWEVMQEFGLEDHLRELFPSSRDARGWMLNNAFDTSPNLLKLPRELTGINDGGPVMFTYFSMAWYQLALILYNGNHTDGADRGAQRPIDWSYIPGFVWAMQAVGEGSPPTNALLTEWLVKGMQATANSLKPNAPEGQGWVPRVAGDPSRLVVPGHLMGWTDMTNEERRAIMEAVLSAWWEKTRTYAVEDWLNGGGADQTELINGWYDGSLGNRIWYMLPHFKHHGVDPQLVDTIADWAQTVWTQADWTEVKEATCQSYAYYVRCSSEKL